jgi:hypothetical protein
MLYFVIKAALSGVLAALVSETAKRSPAFEALVASPSTDLDHGRHLAVAGHGGHGSDRLAGGSKLLVCLAIPANVLADGRDAPRRRRLLASIGCQLCAHSVLYLIMVSVIARFDIRP